MDDQGSCVNVACMNWKLTNNFSVSFFLPCLPLSYGFPHIGESKNCYF